MDGILAHVHKILKDRLHISGSRHSTKAPLDIRKETKDVTSEGKKTEVFSLLYGAM